MPDKSPDLYTPETLTHMAETCILAGFVSHPLECVYLIKESRIRTLPVHQV